MPSNFSPSLVLLPTPRKGSRLSFYRMGVGRLWVGCHCLQQASRRVPLWKSPARGLASSSVLGSGHNRWSKIKHDKGKEDALKSKARSILSQELYNASKFGGPDPSFNPRLATAITNAKRGALSKPSIEAAIAKGQGKSVSGAALESITIEAMLPRSVAVIIECQTDQKLRVLQDIRYLINKHGGAVTPTSYLFEKKGRIVFQKKEGTSADDILDEAVEAGALEVDTNNDDQIVIDSSPSELSVVSQKLVEMFGFSIERSSIIHVPKAETAVSVEDKHAEELENVVAVLEEDPSVQDIYINAV